MYVYVIQQQLNKLNPKKVALLLQKVLSVVEVSPLMARGFVHLSN
jgi:hypothetical protein